MAPLPYWPPLLCLLSPPPAPAPLPPPAPALLPPPASLPPSPGSRVVCKNNCKIHVRCEGLVHIEEEQTVPEYYKCKRCGNGIENDEWIEETLENENAILNKL